MARTLYSGISSGTEMLAYRGEIDPGVPLDEGIAVLDGTFSWPFRYGYSCVGRVEDSRGRLRRGALVLGLHPHQGAIVQREEEVVPLGDADPRIATLLPLVETGLQISLDAGAVSHDVVVVSGLGAVGILAAALITRGGGCVIGAEPRAWRRETAAAFGVESHPPEALSELVARRTNGRGADIVVEASGNPDALAASLRLLAHEGTALVASWYGTKAVSLPLGADFHRRRLSIRSTQVTTIPSHLAGRWTVARRRRTAAALLRELPVDRLATHEVRADDAQAAFEAVDQGTEGLVHAALRYDDAIEAYLDV